MIELSREQIYDKLEEWFSDNKLTTTGRLRMSAGDIEKLSNKKEVSYTPHPKVLFVGDSCGSEDYETLCDLFASRRLLTALQAKVKTGSRTMYALSNAVKNNTIMRFEHDGAIIYID